MLFAMLWGASAQSIDFDTVAPHPRLIIKKGDIGAINSRRTQSAAARLTHDRVVAEAERIVGAATLEYSLKGDRLTEVTDELLRRVFYLSYAYLTTEDIRYASRAEREMLAVSGWEDWNEGNLEDLSQITLALAVGYDWLYRALPVHSRSIIGTAIYEKSLQKVDGISFEGENAMVAVGMICGALATLERAPEFCRAMAERCAAAMPSLLERYADDGAFKADVVNWQRNTEATVLLSAALESAVGSDLGAASNKGFMLTPTLMTHLVAPSGKTFNFYGVVDKAVAEPVKYWFARHNAQPWLLNLDEQLAAEGQIREDYQLPLYMFFSSSLDMSKSAKRRENNWLNDGSMPLYIYRSGWESKSDTYFAIKGGEASTDGTQSDAGAFVYERDGVRWATLNGEPYNTITFNGDYLGSSGRSTIREVQLSARRHGVVADLTPKYAKRASKVERTAVIDKNDYLTITDHIENGSQASTIEWSIVTDAVAEVTAPNTIVLRKDGKSLYLRVRTRLAADAKVWESEGGLRRVGFVVDMRSGATADIEVSLTGERTKGISLPKLNLLHKLRK